MYRTIDSGVGAAVSRPASSRPASRVGATSRTVAAARPPAPTGFRHEGVVWSGTDQFLDHTLPFVREGLAAGDHVLAALSPRSAGPLREALGADAARVRFVDPDAVGRSPGRRLQGWLDLVAAHGAVPARDALPAHDAAPAPYIVPAHNGLPTPDHHPSRPPNPAATTRLRALTEPVRGDHRPAEIAEAHLHEAVLNLAIPESAPLSLMCLYDADAVAAGVLNHACRTHPCMIGPTTDIVGYEGPDYARRLIADPLPPASSEAGSLVFTAGGLSLVRHRVAQVAGDEGLAASRIDDLTVAVNEVAANSLDHGGGRGDLRHWTEPRALVFEVRDSGRLTDPLVGRISPESGQSRGRGLWMANHLGDLLQIRSDATGTTARVTTWT